jgi:hypothetical protein
VVVVPVVAAVVFPAWDVCKSRNPPAECPTGRGEAPGIPGRAALV